MSPMLNATLIASVFGIFGFFLAFSLKRVAGIVLFGVFTYAAFLALHFLGATTDWKVFTSFIGTLSHLGKTTIDLIGGMLNTATLVSIICFLGGGLIGIVVRH
ncbi:MAG: hypothetical protein WCQ90_05750 [Deltaproteobacteria bacterium]|jgi:cytosine/uracil/thiamine/allantoin permease